jgi:hypothetical protein
VAAKPAGKTTDAKIAAPVANGNPPGPAAPVVPPVPAAISAPLFGGFRGGRKRKDGLKPGSPEALQVDRDKNAARMRDKRAAKSTAATPAPLPPALPGATLPLADAGTEKTLPPLPGVAGVPALEAPALALAWEARDLLPVTENGVPILEEFASRQIVFKARRARLPAEIVTEIERDCKWPDKSKKMLAETSGALAAKYLNKAGISAEYKVEVNFSIAVLNIAANHLSILRRLDKLIAAANVQPVPVTPPPAEKKSPQ